MDDCQFSGYVLSYPRRSEYLPSVVDPLQLRRESTVLLGWSGNGPASINESQRAPSVLEIPASKYDGPPRPRSSKACVHCRTRKVRCSGDSPTCQRCIERNLQCEYKKIPRKVRRGLAARLVTNQEPPIQFHHSSTILFPDPESPVKAGRTNCNQKDTGVVDSCELTPRVGARSMFGDMDIPLPKPSFLGEAGSDASSASSSVSSTSSTSTSYFDVERLVLSLNRTASSTSSTSSSVTSTSSIQTSPTLSDCLLNFDDYVRYDSSYSLSESCLSEAPSQVELADLTLMSGDAVC